MAIFRNPFFKSKNDDVESKYTKGVLSLQKGENDLAAACFQEAAAGGHVSAFHNLSLMQGAGIISPWNFDLAADYWYKAAELEHPAAKGSLWLLEAADRGGFGYDNLAKMVGAPENRGIINGHLMTCAARFTDVLCKKFGATNDVIAYELDAARHGEDESVAAFLTRTGLSEEMYLGGLNRLIEGSAADQITDGLNQFSVAQLKNGVQENHVRLARCAIIGYVIQKSVYGGKSQPLLGFDKFFQNAPMTKPAQTGPSSQLNVMGHDLEVVSIIRNGKLLFTSDVVKNYPKEQLQGQIIEVEFSTRSGNPYFVYYLCEDYYWAVSVPGNASSFGGATKAEKFRSEASQNIALFLVNHMKAVHRIDASRDISSFSHNRANTNVLAYVESLRNWYPVQHNQTEDDDASESKVLGVNRGRLDISDVIAVDEPSPS